MSVYMCVCVCQCVSVDEGRAGRFRAHVPLPVRGARARETNATPLQGTYLWTSYVQGQGHDLTYVDDKTQSNKRSVPPMYLHTVAVWHQVSGIPACWTTAVAWPS